MQDECVNHPILKLISVGGAWFIGVTWGERASMLAAIYTLCLIFEWLWKRLVKPLALRRGWIKGRPRCFMDSTDRGPL